MYGQAHGWAQGELQPHGSLNHLYRAFLLDFLWPVNLICLVLSPYLMCFRVLPYVYVHLLAKMDSSEEVMGMLASSTAFPHTCVVEKIFLTSRIRKYMAFYLFYSQGSALLLVFILECLSTGDKLWLFNPVSICLLPQSYYGKRAQVDFSSDCDEKSSSQLVFSIFLQNSYIPC